MPDLFKVFLRVGQQRTFRPALKNLGNKNAVVGQNLFGELISGLHHPDGAQMVRLLVSGRVCGHVAHHNVRLAV